MFWQVVVCSPPCASACGGAPSERSCCLCLHPPPASPPSHGWPCSLSRQGPTAFTTCAETDGAKEHVWSFLHSLMASPSAVSWHQLQMWHDLSSCIHMVSALNNSYTQAPFCSLELFFCSSLNLFSTAATFFFLLKNMHSIACIFYFCLLYFYHMCILFFLCMWI